MRHDSAHPSVTRDIGRTLGAWITGQLTIACILAVLYAAGFAISRVPGWYVLAPICALLYLLPVVGGVIALALTMLAVWVGDGDSYAFIGALITYVVVQGVEGFYLTPKILGNRLRLPGISVFLAILLGGLAFGFIGVLLAAPLLAIIAILWRHWMARRV